MSDLCFCILVMPFSTYRFLNGHNYFADGDVLCILFPLVNYLNVGVSLLSVAAISINRQVSLTLTRISFFLLVVVVFCIQVNSAAAAADAR